MQADAALAALRKGPTPQDIDGAEALLKTLRDARQFGHLSELAELVSRYRPDDPLVHKLHAQALIECGRLTLAVELLTGVLNRTDPDHGQYPELQGLLGRAYKQLFMDTSGLDGATRQSFLRKSVAVYKAAFDRDPSRYWHGINLCALAHLGERQQIDLQVSSSADYARRVLASLEAIPERKRDEWWHPTKAEVHLALGQLTDAETELGEYLRDPRIFAFHVASTARQLREVWTVQEQSEAGARLLQILEADLAHRPGAIFTVDSRHLLATRAVESVDHEQLQRLAGPKGLETLRWYRTGLERAGCVAAICEVLGLRFGTGFTVKSGDFGIQPANEILLLTNWHVLNSAGFGGRADFGNVEVLFEAVSDVPLRFEVGGVIAESPAEGGLDYSLLRLEGAKDALRALMLTQAIAARTSKARIYVIGYPLGDALQFSLQDNVLLDHECPPDGQPQNLERRRVHYSAATEKGSSGSPVFDEYWQCIALHHAGGKRDPQRGEYGIAALNGGYTLVEANEGIWMGSIQDDVRKKNLRLS